MQGGTTFHFVTEGPEEALRLATEAAGDRSISVAGGASTINQYLRAGYIDELRLHVAPIVLGSGEALFRDLKGLSFEVASSRSTSLVTHVTLRRTTG
jgi:dihydrofolate reductase